MRRLSSMVLRPGAGAPVFLFAGAGGDGDELDGLADALAARLPAGAAIVSLAAAAGPEDTVETLATEATALMHGRAQAEAASETARKTFEEGAIASDLPTVAITAAELNDGIGVLGAFVRAGLVASNGEARRQIKSGGLRLNDVAVSDDKVILTSANLTSDGVIKLSMGKKRHVLLKIA